MKIALTVASPNEIEREVIERRTQVGVVPLHCRLPALNYHPLYEETLFLYCSASHPLARQTTPPDLELVRAQDFVVPGYTLNETFQEFFPHKTPAARTNKMEGVATLILSGKFIGFMPDHFAKRWVEGGQMRTLLSDRLQVSIPFVAITYRDVQPSLLRDAFLADMLAAHALGAPDGS